MLVTIHPLDEADIPAFARLELEAFRSHPRIPMLWPNGYTPDLYAFYESGKLAAFKSAEGRMWKAVDDETGMIVGCLQATFALDPEKNAKTEVPAEDENPPANWPKGGNWEMRKWFTINAAGLYQDSFQGRGYILVDYLVIDPQYHGKGIGTTLLQVAIQEADQRGVPLGLESSPAGLSLYKRHGFEEVKTIKADMRDFGWREAYDEEAAKRVWMVREARA